MRILSRYGTDLLTCTSLSLKIQRHHFRSLSEHSQINQKPPFVPSFGIEDSLSSLPTSCRGCGAYAQTAKPDEAGYFASSRRSVKSYIAHIHEVSLAQYEGKETPKCMNEGTDNPLDRKIGSPKSNDGQVSPDGSIPQAPLCNRCHQLSNHSNGAPITHPSILSLQEIVAASPFKYNHIYHVLDAADFPLSLIPNLQQQFALNAQRSRNRRAKLSTFHRGKLQDVTFIITRSDLLAPQKEQVDRLMPQLVQILRDALGSAAENARLSNVRCVSAKRGWWTPQLKEDIWRRGGGCWMVGKANVGKSNLVESVYPKGRSHIQEDAFALTNRTVKTPSTFQESDSSGTASDLRSITHVTRPKALDNSVLPPSPIETNYPVLPLVTSMPGTTAAPIRLPFGNGSGELIDLPGLNRGNLDTYVRDDHKTDMIMLRRPKPQSLSIKPGYSLLVGGLILIKCLTPEVTLLARPFLPIGCHAGKAEKMDSILHQTTAVSSYSIAKSKAKEQMMCAGRYAMKWDVTKQRAGPLTRKDAVALDAQHLPFIIFSLDILIEGCGWIELVAQVRRKSFEHHLATCAPDNEEAYPQILITSPEGRHVGVRRPLNASVLAIKPVVSARVRPRKSMRGAKRLSK